MTEQERIDSEIDHGTWNRLLVLAEIAETEGNAERAAGYRWLAGRRSYPAWRPVYGGDAWGWGVALDCNRPEHLPFSDTGPQIQDVKFQRLSEAFRAAADYVGTTQK